MKENRFYFIIALLLILAITAPYLYASQTGNSERVFSGFLMNYQDGNSYLSKMYQGWEGSWRFRLTYTPNSGNGVFGIYLFYLGLGHISRIFNISLLAVFHFARVVGALCLLLALARLWRSLFADPQHRKLAFAISALGSGLGWLALPFGEIPSDFWVAETYPFLSSYTNPHFAFGLALIILIITPTEKKHPLWIFAASLALAVMSPFGVVIALMVVGSDLLFRQDFRSLRNLGSLIPQSWKIIAVFLGGVPLVAYQYWLFHSDPFMMGWNAQNQTLTPPLWDVLLSLSPGIILALAGVRWAWEQKAARILILWAGLGLILIFIPWSLQRRFMMGIYVPLAGLATLGLKSLGQKIKPSYRTLIIILFILALPTNLILIFSGIHAAQTQEPTICLTIDEIQAYNWIEANTPPNALILTGPETGLYIPAYTGRSVIYGHPYETVDAETSKATVTAFFSGEMTPTQADTLLQTQGVDYILIGPREQILVDSPLPMGEGLGVRVASSNLKLIFSVGSTANAVQIYEVLP